MSENDPVTEPLLAFKINCFLFIPSLAGQRSMAPISHDWPVDLFAQYTEIKVGGGGLVRCCNVYNSRTR